ncbi:MAG: hypothetical protein IH946_03205, partial [Bacteroidetes bacterium]|nr:hypothetical protein [Bacteroidota bacterium]
MSSGLVNAQFYLSNSFQDAVVTQGMYSNRITVDNSFYYGSNKLISAFPNAFLYGQFIGKETKDKALGKLKESKNIFGLEFDNSVSYSMFKREEDSEGGMYYGLGIKSRNFADLAFTSDLFELVFYGNASMAGDTALLAGININRFRYNQVQLSAKRLIIRADNSLAFGGGVSFIQGANYISGEIVDGSIYTQEDGEFLDVRINFIGEISDTSDLRTLAFNGTGFSADLSFMYHSPNIDVDVHLTDLGVISWNDQSAKLAKDTLVLWEGLVLDDVLNSSGSFFDEEALDSLLDDLMPDENKGSLSSKLPMNLYLFFSRPFSENKIKAGIGLHHRFFVNYSPMVFFRGSYLLNDNFSFGLNASYGGYGSVNFGLELDQAIAGFRYKLGSQALLGWILPKSATAS